MAEDVFAPDALADLLAAPDESLATSVAGVAERLLGFGEATLEAWLAAGQRRPTRARVEGYRLLALHRQAARGVPSFNACRETCRELIYQCNMAKVGEGAAERARRLRLAAMVARHLALFVGGKLEESGLGEFCCSAKPLHAAPNARSDMGVI